MSRGHRVPALRVASLLVAAACSERAEERPAAHDGAAAEAPVETALAFADATEEAGLAGFRQVNGTPEKRWILGSVGGGVALLDFDGDGWLDAYLSNGARGGTDWRAEPAPDAPRDAFYRGDGDGTFTEATDAVGLDERRWTNGVRTADLDGDGWTDVHLANLGPNRMLRNEGGRRFGPFPGAEDLADPGWSTGAAFLDFDRDGDLDLYVVNYVDLDAGELPPPSRQYKGLETFFGPRGLAEARDSFYVNLGDGRFEEAAGRLGLGEARGFGFQAVVLDVEGDGWLDLYVANDSTPNHLWHNEAGERFRDGGGRAGISHGKSGKAQAGMGVALGDPDGDLDLDVFVTNFSEDYFTLYENLGGGLFADATLRSGVGLPTWDSLGWGCGFEDLDADGDVDLFCANGHVFPQVDGFASGMRYAQRNQVFENDGRGVFREVTAGAGPGFAVRAASRGVAVGDVDNDGDSDLLVGNLDGPPTLLRNDTPQGHWVRFRLPDLEAGALLRVRAGGVEHLRPFGEGSGFLSSGDPRVHVGLGAAERVEELRVTWPDGSADVHTDLAADVVYDLARGRAPEPRRAR